MSRNNTTNIIRADEAYSKGELLQRLGISQKFWDLMLNDGLPFTKVGKGRWVRGQDVLDYFQKRSETKQAVQHAR